ncbi:response regulator transcription factor [Solihabitans fulvus]|uniref:Response regulator transcription factor n=1 Tax=Solihabitans fulvus TaxID=1892852 RepID=A0A5B2XPS6_9PSEU|nr:response regulator transcription factor [Solihabitans fulvus]KAA2264872.1 response regulator transcription factor [Solihabitans fulvus]
MNIADQVVVIHGEQELYARTSHLFAAAHEEVSCAANSLYSWAVARGRVRADGGYPSSMRIRKLYRPGMLLEPASVRHVQMVAARGAQVRISFTELNETVLIDREIAILAGDASHGPRSFTVMRLPEVVQGVSSLFEAAWLASGELDTYDRELAELRPLAPRIVEALSSGCTDETAARGLGLSLRTYRRRVAELMDTLGAESRFQAGVRARELRLI